MKVLEKKVVKSAYVIYNEKGVPIGVINDFDKAMAFISDSEKKERYYTWKAFKVNELIAGEQP